MENQRERVDQRVSGGPGPAPRGHLQLSVSLTLICTVFIKCPHKTGVKKRTFALIVDKNHLSFSIAQFQLDSDCVNLFFFYFRTYIMNVLFTLHFRLQFEFPCSFKQIKPTSCRLAFLRPTSCNRPCTLPPCHQWKLSFSLPE